GWGRCGGPLLEKREKRGTPGLHYELSKTSGVIIATPEKVATRLQWTTNSISCINQQLLTKNTICSNQ
ncbi:MAG: hypothetical protein WBF25_03900, partial [Terriglobales bacterium]